MCVQTHLPYRYIPELLELGPQFGVSAQGLQPHVELRDAARPLHLAL